VLLLLLLGVLGGGPQAAGLGDGVPALLEDPCSRSFINLLRLSRSTIMLLLLLLMIVRLRLHLRGFRVSSYLHHPSLVLLLLLLLPLVVGRVPVVAVVLVGCLGVLLLLLWLRQSDLIATSLVLLRR